MPIALKRAYEKRTSSDGTRVLVERLWPRGISKEAAGIDFWMKGLAPSTSLRKWFHQRPSMWVQFRKKYLEELSNPEASEALDELHSLAAKRKRLTLVFGSKDEQHNNAIVLKELLEGMRKPPSTTGPEGAAAMTSRARMRARK